MDQEKYKLGIIDEQQAEVEEFFRFFEDFFEPIEIELVNDKQRIIQNIIATQVDAVVIDYKLMEHSHPPVNFNGNELLQELNDQLFGFPAFIMTQYPPEARNHRIDPFKIISKDLRQPDENESKYEEGRELIASIRTSIKNYRNELAEKETRLLELIEKKEKEGKLTDFEEEEMIDLDTFLDKSINMKLRLPKKWKRPEEMSKLDELLKGTQELINDLKKKENE